jgi:hypothetical protein
VSHEEGIGAVGREVVLPLAVQKDDLRLDRIVGPSLLLSATSARLGGARTGGIFMTKRQNLSSDSESGVSLAAALDVPISNCCLAAGAAVDSLPYITCRQLGLAWAYHLGC